MFEKNVTLMKYSYLNGSKRVYAFEVMDKFNVADETERLDAMIVKSQQLSKKLPGYEQLWIKNTVIV